FICPVYVFSFNHTSPPQIYTLSLHDALPISLNIELPPGVRIEDTAAVSAAAYRIVARQPEVTNVVESIGTDDIGDIRSGQLFISLVPRNQRTVSQRQWEDRVIKELKTIPDAR